MDWHTLLRLFPCYGTVTYKGFGQLEYCATLVVSNLSGAALRHAICVHCRMSPAGGFHACSGQPKKEHLLIADERPRARRRSIAAVRRGIRNCIATGHERQPLFSPRSLHANVTFAALISVAATLKWQRTGHRRKGPRAGPPLAQHTRQTAKDHVLVVGREEQGQRRIACMRQRRRGVFIRRYRWHGLNNHKQRAAAPLVELRGLAAPHWDRR